jgi:raffinose synthase
MQLSNLLGKLPTGLRSLGRSTADGVTFLSLHGDAVRTGVDGVRLLKCQRLLSIERTRQWWCRPRWGRSVADLAPREADRDKHQIQCLIWERDDGCGVAVPLIDGDVRCYLTGPPPGTPAAPGPSGTPAIHAGEGVSLITRGFVGEAPKSILALAVAHGTDPVHTVAAVMRAISQRLGTFTLREDKTTDPWMDELGWCTWDAFRDEVTATKTLHGLRSLKKAGVPIRMVIVDDGWQDTDEAQRLRSFRADARKFPRGLASVARSAAKLGVTRLGAWMTLQGYWKGLAPEGELAKRHDTLRSAQNMVSDKNKNPIGPATFVDPADASRFFDEWFASLAEEGVGLAKVDDQSTHDRFVEGVRGLGGSALAYQRSLQAAAVRHLQNNLLHCMCHSSDVVLNLRTSACVRGSPDFNIKSQTAQQQLIANNAMNAIWLSCVAWLDWDLFVSGVPGAGAQAAGRAMSGGPIYCADKPGHHDAQLLRSLATSDGCTIRFPQPALPTPDRVFVDCLHGDALLNIFNHALGVGLLGLFHCREAKESADQLADQKAIQDQFRPLDVPGLKGKRFAVYLTQRRSLVVLSSSQACEVTVDHADYELATISPLKRVGKAWVAPLGLLDKLAGPATIVSWRVKRGGAIECSLIDGGRVGFYCSAKPDRVLVNGKPARFNREKSGLTVIKTGTGKQVDVMLRFDSIPQRRRSPVNTRTKP